MTSIRLEHVNITVSDPLKTAKMLDDLFGWKIRWQGDSLGGGFTVHVGTDTQYLALYNPNDTISAGDSSYRTIAGFNHVALVVDDLDAVEAAVIKAGFTPTSHADYEPGKRFYFDDHDGVEYEIVSYV